VRWTIGFTLLITIVAQFSPAVRAASDPMLELQKAEQQLEYIRQQQELTKNQLADTYWRAREAQALLVAAEQELALANSRLAVATNQLTVVEAELVQVEADLVDARARFESHRSTLSSRIRALHEEGRINYIAVLFGSASFNDFITRFDLLKVIVKRDIRLFDVVKEERRSLEQAQIAVTDRRNRLTELKAQAETNRALIVTKRQERETAISELEVLRRRLEVQVDDFDRQAQETREKVAEIQRELARRAGRFVPSLPLKPVSITSDFGSRIHPILGTWRMHSGTDFAAFTGQPIYAIEDGLVIVAGYDYTYGNLVVVDHGGGIASWYAHADSLLVRIGADVKRGQQISRAGSTGQSTGPHLHLEIHINGKPVDPMEYLKP
jgi:murein DD-endopeptidase MepM/ murein hydrolase activator NlpD